MMHTLSLNVPVSGGPAAVITMMGIPGTITHRWRRNLGARRAFKISFTREHDLTLWEVSVGIRVTQDGDGFLQILIYLPAQFALHFMLHLFGLILHSFSFYDFLEVDFVYSKPYIVKVYSLMYLHTCMHLCEIKIPNICYLQKFFVFLCSSSLLLPLPPAITVCFLSLQVSRHFLEFYINGNMHHESFFCQASLIQLHHCIYWYSARDIPFPC